MRPGRGCGAAPFETQTRWQVANEVRLMTQFHHPNVLRAYTCLTKTRVISGLGTPVSCPRRSHAAPCRGVATRSGAAAARVIGPGSSSSSTTAPGVCSCCMCGCHLACVGGVWGGGTRLPCPAASAGTGRSAQRRASCCGSVVHPAGRRPRAVSLQQELAACACVLRQRPAPAWRPSHPAGLDSPRGCGRASLRVRRRCVPWRPR